MLTHVEGSWKLTISHNPAWPTRTKNLVKALLVEPLHQVKTSTAKGLAAILAGILRYTQTHLHAYMAEYLQNMQLEKKYAHRPYMLMCLWCWDLLCSICLWMLWKFQLLASELLGNTLGTHTYMYDQ